MIKIGILHYKRINIIFANLVQINIIENIMRHIEKVEGSHLKNIIKNIPIM